MLAVVIGGGFVRHHSFAPSERAPLYCLQGQSLLLSYSQVRNGEDILWRVSAVLCVFLSCQYLYYLLFLIANISLSF